MSLRRLLIGSWLVVEPTNATATYARVGKIWKFGETVARPTSVFIDAGYQDGVDATSEEEYLVLQRFFAPFYPHEIVAGQPFSADVNESLCVKPNMIPEDTAADTTFKLGLAINNKVGELTLTRTAADCSSTQNFANAADIVLHLGYLFKTFEFVQFTNAASPAEPVDVDADLLSTSLSGALAVNKAYESANNVFKMRMGWTLAASEVITPQDTVTSTDTFMLLKALDNVANDSGNTVIPSGSFVELRLTEEPTVASESTSRRAGILIPYSANTCQIGDILDWDQIVRINRAFGNEINDDNTIITGNDCRSLASSEASPPKFKLDLSLKATSTGLTNDLAFGPQMYNYDSDCDSYGSNKYTSATLKSVAAEKAAAITQMFKGFWKKDDASTAAADLELINNICAELNVARVDAANSALKTYVAIEKYVSFKKHSVLLGFTLDYTDGLFETTRFQKALQASLEPKIKTVVSEWLPSGAPVIVNMKEIGQKGKMKILPKTSRRLSVLDSDVLYADFEAIKVFESRTATTDIGAAMSSHAADKIADTIYVYVDIVMPLSPFVDEQLKRLSSGASTVLNTICPQTGVAYLDYADCSRFKMVYFDVLDSLNKDDLLPKTSGDGDGDVSWAESSHNHDSTYAASEHSHEKAASAISAFVSMFAVWALCFMF